MTSWPAGVGREILAETDSTNAEALRRCRAAVEAGGAVPAVTAVVDGRWRVGLSEDEEARVLSGTRKVAERDLAVAAAQSWDVGVTTVSASVALAARAGIEVFATGGIGGVHRGVETSGDVSADLDAIAKGGFVRAAAARLKDLADDEANPEREVAALALMRLFLEHQKLAP